MFRGRKLINDFIFSNNHQCFFPILVDTPDPYVKLLIKTAPNGKKQTTVKSNTANPIWDETFQFLLEPDLENILGKLVEFVFSRV